jgi:hypothetical protein
MTPTLVTQDETADYTKFSLSDLASDPCNQACFAEMLTEVADLNCQYNCLTPAEKITSHYLWAVITFPILIAVAIIAGVTIFIVRRKRRQALLKIVEEDETLI